MKKNVLAISITAALVSMAGCSSFNVGAACYIPHGVTGQCSATTVAPAAAQPATATTQPTAEKPRARGA